MERTTEGQTGLYLLSFIQGEPGALGQLGFRVKSKLNANVTEVDIMLDIETERI